MFEKTTDGLKLFYVFDGFNSGPFEDGGLRQSTSYTTRRHDTTTTTTFTTT